MKMVSDNNSRQQRRRQRREQNDRRCSYAFMVPSMILLLFSSAVVVVSAWSTTSNNNKATLHSYSFTTSSSQQRLQRQSHRLITTTTSTSLPFSNAVTAIQEAEATSGGVNESSKQKRKQKNKIRGKTTKNKNNNKSNQKKGQQRVQQQPKNKQQSQQPRRGWKGKQKQTNKKKSTTKKKTTTRKKFNSVSELVLEVRKLLNSTTTSTLSQSQSQSRRPNSSWRTALSILKHAATIPHDAIIIVDDKDKGNSVNSVDDLNDLESILSTTPKKIAERNNNDIDDDNGNYLLSFKAKPPSTTSISTTTPTKTILPVRVYHQVLECIKKQKTASSWQDAIRLIQYMENGADDETGNNIINSNSNSNIDINRGGGGGDDDTWYIPSPNYEIYNTVIECTSQGGRKDSDDASVYWLSKMLQKFDKDDNKNISIRDRKLVRNTIQLVLSNLTKQRKWREALRLLDYMEMKADEIPISVVQYNTVLSCLAKSKQVGQCQRLLQRLQKKSKEQHQQRQQEENELEQLDKDDDNSLTRAVVGTKTTYPLLLRPDEISYNAVIGACASAGKWKEALDVLDECYNEPGVEPNIYIYTNAIRACAKAGKTQRALSLLDIVKEKGLPVDSYCYTAVIDACSKGRQWKKALEIFDEMEEKGIVPTQVTYSVTISALGNGLQWERALSLLNVMRDKGMRVNLYTYNAAITALAKSSRKRHSAMLSSSTTSLDTTQQEMTDREELWPKALDLLNQMNKDGIEPDGFCYSSAINCCGAEGRWEEACKLIETMKRGGPGSQPNKIAYTSAISACGRAGQASKALELFQNMVDEGIPVDNVAYNALFSALRISKDADKAYELWGEICGTRSLTTSITSSIATARDNASPDIITLTDCIATLSRAGYTRKMDEVFRQAVEREGILLQSNDSLDSIWEVDLNGKPFPIARAACRYLLQTISDKYKSGTGIALEDMVFITGTGVAHQKKEEETPSVSAPSASTNNVLDKKDRTTSLRDFVQGILETDFDPPIESIVPSLAQGTVVIEEKALKKWLDQKERKVINA